MLPANTSYTYPYEIDILEALGHDPTDMEMHYSYNNRSSSYTPNYTSGKNGACADLDYSQGYHNFGVDWEPTFIAFYIDGVKCGQFKGSVGNGSISNVPMQLILNHMVSVDWQRSVGKPLLDTSLTRELDVDYIHVWQQVPSSGDTTPPSTPAGLTATAVSSSQINLSWTASTDNVGVTGYQIYRGGTLLTTVAGTSYSNTGLSPSTSYSYYVRAADAAGNFSGNSNTASATTQAGNPVPTATLTANPTSITSGQSSTLTWSSTNATSCTGTNFTASGTSGSTSVSPTVTTTYSVTCTGAGGTSPAASATVTVSSAGTPDLIVTSITSSPANPAAGQAVTFSAVAKNQGTAATPAGTILGVLFSVDGAVSNWSDTNTTSLAAGASVTLTANGGPTSATWSATAGTHTILANVDDVNRITESNESNNTFSTSLTVAAPDTTPPSTPAGLTATAVSSSQINLSWTASTDNVGVTGYKIFRDGVQVGTSATNSFSNTGLAASTVYSYTVSANDAAGNNSAPRQTRQCYYG